VEVVILIGLPGSGKSTFARQQLPGHVVVSKDLMPSNRAKDRRQAELIVAALREGRSVVVDNTNPRRTDRAPLIALAREHGARVVGYFFDAAPRDCVARNKQREGRARVPDVAIFVTAKRLERPQADEGFDALAVVRVTDGGGFSVEPL
jgi:predicted kinase